ncbi:MAG: hypothetical protein ACHQLQ_00925 [Candidatus Acidiferrales bacterium]
MSRPADRELAARRGVQWCEEARTSHPCERGAGLLESHWRYKPIILNGQPVEIDTFTTVVYNINR